MRLAGAAAVVILAAALAGCGIRGPLEAPPGTPGEPGKSSKSGNANTPKAPEPHRPFILDGLIR